jgi:hypothetical protein
VGNRGERLGRALGRCPRSATRPAGQRRDPNRSARVPNKLDLRDRVEAVVYVDRLRSRPGSGRSTWE